MSTTTSKRDRGFDYVVPPSSGSVSQEDLDRIKLRLDTQLTERLGRHTLCHDVLFVVGFDGAYFRGGQMFFKAWGYSQSSGELTVYHVSPTKNALRPVESLKEDERPYVTNPFSAQRLSKSWNAFPKLFAMIGTYGGVQNKGEGSGSKFLTFTYEYVVGPNPTKELRPIFALVTSFDELLRDTTQQVLFILVTVTAVVDDVSGARTTHVVTGESGRHTIIYQFQKRTYDTKVLNVGGMYAVTGIRWNPNRQYSNWIVGSYGHFIELPVLREIVGGDTLDCWCGRMEKDRATEAWLPAEMHVPPVLDDGM